MGKFAEVGKTTDISPDSPTCVEVEGTEIALFLHDGEYYAIDNTCTHQGGPLCEGVLEDGEVECPWHGARFDITSGDVIAPPAGQPVSHYNVRVSGDTLEVEL
ncbi:MAG TPA: non-heme iron oxygenase ferredoxin subunit [bacterium]|nr:non-heme iron oxygenase ferredoxin subunit [bacterium]